MSLSYIRGMAAQRILVTDDDDGVRNALARFLQRQGYEVVQADGGDAALDILAHGHFDGMLCDIRMPGMTGVELLPKVVAHDSDIAVIMLTAVGDPGSAIQCLKLGATDYLIKPVELDELAHALQYALRKRELEVERRGMEQWLAREVAEKTRELHEQSRQVELLALSILQSMVDETAEPGHGAGGRNHSLRVSNLSAHVASELGCDAQTIEFVRLGARLHGVAPRILDPLRQYGEVVNIIRHQDDRYDAGGESIPLGARVVAVVKRFDDMTEGSGAMKPSDAVKALEALGGKELDPAVVIALAAVIARRAH